MDKHFELYVDNAGCHHLFALDDSGVPVAGFCDDGDADLMWATLQDYCGDGDDDPVDPVEWEGQFDDVAGAYQWIVDAVNARNGGAHELDPAQFAVWRYYIVDRIAGGDCFDHVCPAIFGDVRTAIRKADTEWAALSDYDKRRRSDFYLCKVQIGIDDRPDHDTVQIIKVYK